MTLHPQRCETCKTPGWVNNPGEVGTCPIWSVREKKLSKDERKYHNKSVEKILECVGCASHSNAASGREQVLDELEARLTRTWEDAKEMGDDPEWEETHSFSLPYLLKEIAELRKRGEQQ